MSQQVGPEGQVIIEKEIRDRLGIEPGATVIQQVVDDHVEIYFLPPVKLHNRSLRGILKSDISVSPEEWHAAKQRAWDEAVAEDWEQCQRELKNRE